MALLQTPRRHLPRGPVFIAAQFVPMAVLALAYLAASDRIESVWLGGVRLDRLLLTSAIIAPILSQSVSGPLFRSLEVAPHHRFAQSATLTLRHLPRAMLLAAPVLVAVAVLTAWSLDMGYSGALALVAVVWVHVLFAATLVPAYAHRLGGLLVVGWGAYAATLAAAPEVWWAPSVAGFGSQLIVLLHVCETRLPLVPVASIGQLLGGMGRGMALALPLWCLPATVYLASAGTISPVAIFLSLTPALIAYQLYFVQVATPIWTRIDTARRMLETDTYSAARVELMTIGLVIRSGLLRVVGVLVGLLLIAGGIAFRESPGQAWFLLALMIAAGLSVVLIAEVTRLSMVTDGPAMYLVSTGIVSLLLAGVANGLDARALVGAHLVCCTVALIAVREANQAAWRTPEYSLFWAKALQH